MKWAFATNQVSLENPKEDWQRLIRAAVHSALQNTTLRPFMIYDGGESEFIEELRSLGVTIIRHRVSFYDFLVKYQQVNKPDDPHFLQTASSAFLRVDLPILFPEDDFLLYTDCDVMFLRDPLVKDLKPVDFACAPERDRGDTLAANINTGVMVMNLESLARSHASFCSFICENYADLVSFDQGAYISYYGERVEFLPDELNWKPYWGLGEDAQIVHFHGPKPRNALAAATNPHYQTAPIILELFGQNRDAYMHYVNTWIEFQQRSRSPEKEPQSHNVHSRPSAVVGHPDAADSLPFLRLLSKLNETLAATGERIEGNVCYLDQTSPNELVTTLPTPERNHVAKRKNLGAVARRSSMMLEVGLNGGHSALLCLTSNPNITFVAVDIFYHKYTEHAAQFLKAQFPRRFHYLRGDSREVLPRLALEKPNLKFDALHVDGGHAEDLAYADISNALRIAQKDALFIVDDLQASWLARIFQECLMLGHFRPAPAGDYIQNALHDVVIVN